MRPPLLITFLSGLLVLSVGFCAVLVFEPEPPTEILDSDLANIRREIASAETESAKYQGGLIKSFIDLRIQTLRLSDAMLSAKRLSVLRRVNLNYIVDSQPIRPTSDLTEIERDIAQQKMRVAESALKAAQYNGGLVQAMALGALETERLSLAMLQLSYYGQKYGLPTPGPKDATGLPAAKPTAPGKIVDDKDAL